MSPEPRFVFDNNALISALLFERSVPGQAFYGALEQGVILISQPSFTELNDVLRREKFDRYVTREEREQFLAMFLQEATLVEITEEIHACRDPKDDKFSSRGGIVGRFCPLSALSNAAPPSVNVQPTNRTPVRALTDH